MKNPESRVLPSDQQAMQDDLSNAANLAEDTGAVRDAGDTATDIANTAIIGKEALDYGAKGTNFFSRLFTGKNLIKGALTANRYTNVPLITATLADMGTAEVRNLMGYNDGKGLFDLVGEDLGKAYVDLNIGNNGIRAQQELNQKPFTEEEKQLIADGFNPLKPIKETVSVGAPTLYGRPTTFEKITGYEKMNNSVASPTGNATEPKNNVTLLDSDPMTPEDLQNIENMKSEMALANAKPSPTMVDSDLMTPQDRQNIEDMRSEETLARMSRKGPQNLQEALTERYGLANADGQSALQTMPAYPTGNFQGDPNNLITNLQGAPSANGQMRVGIAPPYDGQLSDEQILEQRQLRAQSLANSNPRALPPMGRDATKARIAELYGLDAPATLNQAMTNNPNAVLDTDAQGRIRSFESREAREKNIADAQAAFEQASLDRQLAIGGTGSYEGDSRAMQDKLNTASGLETLPEVSPSSPADAETPPEAPVAPLETPVGASETSTPPNPPTSPEESPAPAGTPDSEKTEEQLEYERQIAEDDEGLMKWARENNKSPEYVEQMMEGIVERREQAQKEKKLEDLLSELQIEGDQLRNIRLAQQIEEASLPPEVSMADVNSLRRTMESMGVSQDGTTGNLTVTDEGFWTDTERPLGPTSALFYMLNKTEAGRHILNMTPAEINIVKNPDSSLKYPTKDGRFFTWDDEEQEWNIYLPRPLGSTFNQLDENGLMPDEDQVA